MAELDISELDEVVGPTDEQLKSITTLADRQIAAERNVVLLTEQLAAAKVNLNTIKENLLPDAMRACNLEMFRTGAGVSIEIKENLYASITEANRPKALDWLREHNHGAIIKNNVTVPFLATDAEFEKELTEFLDSHEVKFDKKMNVHARTLTAWVKEQLRQDNEVPESISYFEQRISKVVK